MQLFGLHKHKGGQIIGPQEDAGVGPNEAGVYGLVKNFVNNEGANLVLGDVVKGSAGSGTVEKTETLNDPAVVGVVAGNGPYANGAVVPVVISGWHPAVKVTGAAAAGAYLTASNTDGTAQAQTPAGAGSFARATSAAAAGTAPAIIFDPNLGAAVNNFVDLGDVPHAYTAHGGEAVRVNAGATALEFVTFPSSGSIEYDPRRAPAAPHASNDEFDDLSLAGAWTTGSSGGGSSGGADETLRKGFLRLAVTDGGAGSGRTVKRAFVPGAVAITVAAHVFGNVRDAGSNQVRIEVLNNAGALIYGVGMVNIPGPGVIFFDNGTFGTVQVSYITPLIGEIWLMVQRDAGTNWSSWISGDGMVWTRLSGKSIAGTIGEVLLAVYSFSATTTESWWDFIRCFTSNTFTIGGTP